MTVERARPALADCRDPQHAQWEGYALANLPVAHANQFEAAAAQVSDDAVGMGDRGQHALARALRLLLAGQYLDVEAKRLGGRDQFPAIACVANRGGGDGAQRSHLHLARDGGEAGQRDSRLGQARPLDRTRRGQPLAQARHDLLVEQDRRQSRRPLIDDEADRVGSDVDDRGPGCRRRCLFGAAVEQRRDDAQCPRRSDNVGTDCAVASAAPRPDSDGLVIK